METINLKEADNKKILGLKISGEHVVALQQTADSKYKISVYGLNNTEKNKEVYSHDDITYSATPSKNWFDLS